MSLPSQDLLSDATALIERAAELCKSAWGLSGRLTEQASERDHIFRIDADDGRRYTLKLTDPGQDAVATDFQTQALLHVAARDPGLPVPHLVHDRIGRVAFPPDWDTPVPPTARLLTWLDGELLASAPRGAAQAAALGRALARLGLALAEFDHPGANHHLHWDLRHTAELSPRLHAVSDPVRRALAERAIDRFATNTAPLLDRMRRQVVHADITPYNVLVDATDPARITGLIDFGDMVRTALVCDVAIAACYLMGSGETATELPEALVAAYHEVRPLDQAEVELVAPLMEARHAMAVAITEEHAARRPDNRAYITKNTETAWRGLATLAAYPAAYWRTRFLRACGMED